MRSRRKGHIVNISSIAGLRSFPSLGYYCSTKYAVEGLSESLWQEVEPLGIKVTLVEPSGFRTDWAGRSANVSENQIADYDQTSGEALKQIRESSGYQPGDPLRAAKAIVQAVESADSPRRLLLGNDAFAGAMGKLSEMQTAFEEYEKVTRWADSPVAKWPLWLGECVDLCLASLRHHAVVHQLLHVVPRGFLTLLSIQLILRMPSQCWHMNCCCNLLVRGTYSLFPKDYHAKQEPFVQSIQNWVLRQTRHSDASRTHRKPCIGRSISRSSERTRGGRAHQSISRIDAQTDSAKSWSPRDHSGISSNAPHNSTGRVDSPK